MVLFALAALLVATVLLLIRVVARAVNQGCRFACTCVHDSAALGALASIAKEPRP